MWLSAVKLRLATVAPIGFPTAETSFLLWSRDTNALVLEAWILHVLYKFSPVRSSGGGLRGAEVRQSSYNRRDSSFTPYIHTPDLYHQSLAR